MLNYLPPLTQSTLLETDLQCLSLSSRKWQGSSQINLQQNDRLINGHIVFEGFNIACQTVHLNLFKMHTGNTFFADCLSLMHTRQERIHRKQIKTERNRLKSSIKAFE